MKQDILRVRKNLAKKLKFLREMKGYSLRELSQRSGISHSHLFLLENNKVASLSLKVLKKLAVAYGMSIEELMRLIGFLKRKGSKPDKERGHWDMLLLNILKEANDFDYQEIKELKKYVQFIKFNRKEEKK